MPDFLVMIPTAGDCKYLAQTLESLGQCELPAGFAGVVVVENGKKGQAEQVVNAAPEHLLPRHLHFERANKSNALNQALRPLADDCFVYLTDDDVRFEPDVLVRFQKQLADRSRGVVLGGPLGIDCDQKPEDWLLKYLPPSMKGWFPDETQLASRRLMFLGANWGVFVGDIKKAGGFDPRFGPGSKLNATGQEWTMQKRLHEMDLSFEFVPAATVWHKVEASRFNSDFVVRRAYRMGVEAGITTAIRPKFGLKNVLILGKQLANQTFAFLTSPLMLLWTNKSSENHLDLQISHQRSKGFFFGFFRSLGQSAEQRN